MDYLTALGSGMNPSTPLNGREITFCFAYYIKGIMYQDSFQFIGCIRNVRIESFFDLQCTNALPGEQKSTPV